MRKYIILFLWMTLNAMDGFGAFRDENQFIPIRETHAKAAYRIWSESVHDKSAQFSKEFQLKLENYADHSLECFLDEATHMPPRHITQKQMDLVLTDGECWERFSAILRKELPADQLRNSGNKTLLMIALDPLVGYTLNVHGKNRSFESFFSKVEDFLTRHQEEETTAKIVALAINIEQLKKNLPQ